MARRAVINDTRMIENRSGETTWYVTNTAILVGRQVIVILAGGVYTIMARRAVIHDTRMIKVRDVSKAGDAMADPAILSRWRMIRCFA